MIVLHSAMRPRNTASSQVATAELRRMEHAKKDITRERADIAGFTLLFKDEETERKWRYSCFPKRAQMTARFLFMSGLYQALFFMSDVSDNDNSIFFKGCWRLGCGLTCWTLCFLVATSLIMPSQIMLFYVQLLYGGLSLFLHFLGRDRVGTWDFLILVYGLCFFMLPKISPLNFIHSFMGSSILSIGFIYISAFWLDLDQWILSTIFLLVISVAFMYIAYSSEKSSRERWLLRQRLNREHIDLQMVASSIQGDLTAAARYRSDRQGGPRPAPRVSNSSSTREKSQTERMNNFFKGLAAWAICMSLGYAFQVIGADEEPGVRSNSKPFALLMHTMGFSIFLLYFTGQMRWFVINGVVGMIMLWIFNETGLDNRWAVISTHSIGYFILALVVVSSILVFGGVVLVWTHLIDFLMNILNRYPEVKEEIRQEKILEQVLVRYLADMPRPAVLQRPSSLAEEEAGLEKSSQTAESENISTLCEKYKRDSIDLSASPGKHQEDIFFTTEPGCRKLSRVLEAKKPNSCYFCSKNEAIFLLPACSGWTPRDRSNGGTLPMCTPYSELAHTRDSLNIQLVELKRRAVAAEEECRDLREQMNKTEEISQMQKIADANMILSLQQQIGESNFRLEEEAKRRDKDIDDIISQHNTQLSEIKKLYKNVQTKQRKFLAHHQGQSSASSGDQNSDRAVDAHSVAPLANVCPMPVDADEPVGFISNNLPDENSERSRKDTDNNINGDFSDIQRDFDRYCYVIFQDYTAANYLLQHSLLFFDQFCRLWNESFAEVQKLLVSGSFTSRWGTLYDLNKDGTAQESPQVRMKYAIHLTKDNTDDNTGKMRP